MHVKGWKFPSGEEVGSGLQQLFRGLLLDDDDVKQVVDPARAHLVLEWVKKERGEKEVMATRVCGCGGRLQTKHCQ